jgi:RHS repeat-associated protein
MTDEAGSVVWRATYDPFGDATVDEDPDGDGTMVTLNVRFPGQYYDNETGLHYNYFRYYDPETGRYIMSDPIGLAGGLNTYSYALLNPIKIIDWTGLLSRCLRPLGGQPGDPPNLYRNHVFSCAVAEDGKFICDGQTNPDNALLFGPGGSTGEDRGDYYNPKACDVVDDNPDRCMDKCMIKKYAEPRPGYTPLPLGPWFGYERCDYWTDSRIEECKLECRKVRYEDVNDAYRQKYCGGYPCQ